MENFNVEKKKGNYDEITKLAQEMMLKINKGKHFKLLRMEEGWMEKGGKRRIRKEEGGKMEGMKNK